MAIRLLTFMIGCDTRYLTAFAGDLPLPSVESLVDFYVYLKSQHYVLSPQQLAAAEYVLLLAWERAWPVERLQSSLRGLLAKDVYQSHDFDRKFDAWFKPSSPAPTDDSSPPEPKPRITISEWVFISASCIVTVAILILLMWPEIFDYEGIVVPWASVKPETVATTTVADSLTLPRRNYYYLTSMLPCIIFCIWLWWRRRRSALWLSRGPKEGPELLDDLPNELLYVPSLFEESLTQAARALRRYRAAGNLMLDITKSIRETAARAGVFTPMWKDMFEAAKYTILIEQEATHDHVARILDIVVDKLKDEGVDIRRFYFHGDPRFLTADNDRRTSVRLSGLVEEGLGSCIIIVGSGDGFAGPLSGEIKAEVRDALSRWAQRVLLSTKPVEDWSLLERDLIRAGFLVGPASSRGIKALADRIAAGPGRGPLLHDSVMYGESAPPTPGSARLPRGSIPPSQPDA